MCKTGHDLSHKSVFQKHILKVNLQQNFMIFFRQPDRYIDKMLRVFTKLQLKTMVTPEVSTSTNRANVHKCSKTPSTASSIERLH